jgi:hypothetical protein
VIQSALRRSQKRIEGIPQERRSHASANGVIVGRSQRRIEGNVVDVS